MATYYVSSVDGSNADAGTSWTLAVATLKYAVETLAATGGPHTILVDSAHSESLTADTTITAAQDLRIISVNRSGSDAPLAGAVIGAQATSYSVTLTGGRRVYVYGLTLRTGTNSGGFKRVTVASNNSNYELDSCTIVSNAGDLGQMQIGENGPHRTFVRFTACSFSFNHVGQGFAVRAGTAVFDNCSFTGTAPTLLISSSYSGNSATFNGCDLSNISTTIAGGETNTTFVVNLINCRLHPSVTILSAPTNATKGGTTAYVFNCDDGDEHFRMGHYDAFGSTVVSNSVYLNDGASHDGGTTKVSWKIDTTANASFYTPYVSPWSDKRWTGTAQIAPYFEALRSGSTTKYQNDEVWAEFSAQATSGSTRASFVNDRTTIWPLSPSDQTASSKTASDWTGEDATNNAYMKLGEQNITPAEIGYLRGRVIVGEPNITVYVCPKIRT